MSLGSWSFAGTTLKVIGTPGFQHAYRVLVHDHAGVDGATLIDDKRLHTVWSLKVRIDTYTDLVTLASAIGGGTRGTFTVPMPNGDTWNYAGAVIQNPQWSWPPTAGYEYWEVTFDVVCPDPRPTLGSTGARVL